MEIASSTQLFNAVASTTGRFIQDSFPVWILFFGIGLALIVAGGIMLVIIRAFK